MTIGVFGDSYATPTCHGGDPETSWVHLIGARSHGLPSTSVLWSYRQFLEHHESYDQCVFIMTDPGRFDHNGKTQQDGMSFIHNLNMSQRILKEGPYKNLRNWIDREWENLDTVRAFRDYYLYLQDDQTDQIYTTLMLEDILRKRPETIIIPIGRHWGTPVSDCWSYTALGIRSMIQGPVPKMFFDEYKELATACHYTPEINRLFADHVRSAKESGGWRDWGIQNMPLIPHSRPFEYYYQALEK